MDISALKNINADFLLSLSDEESEDLEQLLNYVDYNRAEFYRPYGYQLEHFRDGKHKLHRYLSAGNRCGKTYCGAMEMSYHLTGRYPDWWEGNRIDRSGFTYWCIGFNLTMVREIQQKALLGTDNIGDAAKNPELGTGSIPRDCIVTDRIIKDGARVETIYIKHADNGQNTLRFFGATDPDSLQGREVVGCWIDEEPLYSERIWNQLQARISNAKGIGKDGFILVTATPEQGETWFYRKFRDGTSEDMSFRNVTWLDVPERFTPAYIERKKKTLSAHEIDLRINGIPAIGRGAVFKLNEDDISYDPEDIAIQPHWLAQWGTDWGDSAYGDATAFILGYKDPDTGVYYIHDYFGLDVEGGPRDAAAAAELLLQHPMRGAPVIIPSDESAKAKSGQTQGKHLQRMGFNVRTDPFRNPVDTQLNVKRFGLSATAERYNDIERGLIEMNYLFRNGKLKINKHLWKLFREMRSYSYSEKGGYAGSDHFIDASRYCILSLMAMRGDEVYKCGDLQNSQPQGFETIEYTDTQF